MKKIITVTLVTFLLIIGINFTLAASPNTFRDDNPQDTDLDGLTDKGEIELFKTDPNNPDTDQDGFLDGTEKLENTDPLDPNDPPKTIEQPQAQETPWVWYIARISGITSYILLFLIMMTGMGISSGYIFKLFGPIIAWRIHRVMSIGLTIFILTHLVTLYMDKFMNFSLAELLIPFVSDFSPLYLSLGIIGFYLFVLILVTSFVMIVKKYKLWRLLHYLTFPAFVVLFIHGVYIGTDSETLPMQIVYWSTGIIVGLAFIYRLAKIPSRIHRGKKSGTD